MYNNFYLLKGISSPTKCSGKPFTPTGRESYIGTEARPLLHEEAGNHLTKY